MILRIAAAFLTSSGFSVILHIKKKYILFDGIIGALAYYFYNVLLEQDQSLFTAALYSSIFICVMSTIAANVFKAPNTNFIMPPLGPLIPGSYLYYTIYSLIAKDSAYLVYLSQTISILAGISGGIVVVNTLVNIINSRIKARS